MSSAWGVVCLRPTQSRCSGTRLRLRCGAAAAGTRGAAYARGMDERRADFSELPPSTRLDDTIATVDTDPVPDPHADRNVSLDDALRD